MIVGVSGSRTGPTEPQARTLTGTLRDLRIRWGATDLHHGSCVGVDDFAAELAHHLGYWVVAHPPIKLTFRARAYADQVLPDRDYLERDRAIVDACGVLVAVPATVEEQRRSGTWYTIRYARSRPEVRLLVIAPDGTLLEQRGFTFDAAPR